MSRTAVGQARASRRGRGRGVLDAPLEPVIGLAEGETRWRGMTTEAYAARTLTRNSSTALRNMPDWLSSSRALDSTSVAALPVAAAADVTPPIWALISLDPAATDWMLRAISRVASPCWSTALEMLTGISLICAIASVL